MSININLLSFRIMDPLSTVFKQLSFQAAIYLHSTFCSPWQESSSNPNKGTFHLIAEGQCEISHDQGVTKLNAGDLICFTRNQPHDIRNLNESEEFTTLVCGHFTIDEHHQHVFQALPELIHVSAAEFEAMPWFKILFQQLTTEADLQQPGRQMVLDKMAEVLFLYLVRHQLMTNQPEQYLKQGMLRGLTDPQLGQALTAIHADLSHPWTVENMAEQASMSRSRFSNHFHDLVGSTPMKYLNQWRMYKARQSLMLTNQSIFNIALDAGYQSEAAFIKSFKARFEQTPGQWRRANQ